MRHHSIIHCNSSTSRRGIGSVRFARAGLIAASALGLSGCNSGIFDPNGPVGSAEKTILIDSLGIMLAIVLPTIVAIGAFAWWFRASNTRARYLPGWGIQWLPTLATWQGNSVLRLTDGSANEEAATVYFQDTTHVTGLGKQPVAGGFTTWFEFQAHSPLQCCSPGDGVVFIVQNSTATDGRHGRHRLWCHGLGRGR